MKSILGTGKSTMGLSGDFFLEILSMNSCIMGMFILIQLSSLFQYSVSISNDLMLASFWRACATVM